jgi:hypothetical protein
MKNEMFPAFFLLLLFPVRGSLHKRTKRVPLCHKQLTIRMMQGRIDFAY